MKYRNIKKIIIEIKSQVPLSWDRHKTLAFFAGLDDVIDSSNYRAPEAYVVNFDQLAMVLGEHLGNPNTKWKKTIADIFADKIKIPDMTYIEDSNL